MQENVVGVILAGGRSRRMGGGDKGLMRLGGRMMIEHVMRRLQPQVDAVIVNANDDPSRFAFLGAPVIADRAPDYAGPLAGLAAAMGWASANRPETRYIATAACDTPFFPVDLVKVLGAAVDEQDAPIALAASSGQIHPVFGLWPMALADELEEALLAGARKVAEWAGYCGYRAVDFPPLRVDNLTLDPFFNVNTPEDLAEAEQFLALSRDSPA